MLKTISRLGAVLAIALSMAACTQIDTGNVGVESTLGQVKKEVLPPGLYQTATKKVVEVIAKEVPLQINDMKPQTLDKITLADLDVDIYVQIDPSKAAELMLRWPGDLTQPTKSGEYAVGLNYITRQAREQIYTEVAKYRSDIVHTERAAIAAGVVKALQTELDTSLGKGWVFVRSANVRNLVTDPALEANIKAAANSQFLLQKKENDKLVAKAEADRLRIEAQGEADAIRIKAEAIAKQGGAEYVQLQAIQKWDGKLPTTQAGGAVPFINVK